MSLRDHVSNIMDNLYASALWDCAKVLVAAAAVKWRTKIWRRVVAAFRQTKRLSRSLLAKLRSTPPLSLDARIAPETGSIVINQTTLRPAPPQQPEPLGRIPHVRSPSFAGSFDFEQPAANDAVLPKTSQINGTLVPEAWPVGTASAVVMATQPHLQRPQMQVPHVVNNSHWMQFEAARRQDEIAAIVAMQSTMPKFNPATLGMPMMPPADAWDHFERSA
jgi:hypothetical protein